MEFSLTYGFVNLISLIKGYPEILLTLLCFFSIRWYWSMKQKEVLVNWPILGMLPSLLLRGHNVWDWSIGAFQAFDGTFVIKGPIFTDLKILVTCDPHNIEHVLKTNFSNFPKGRDFTEIFDVLGAGIFNAESDTWRVQRSMAHARFKTREFRNFVANVSQEVVAKSLVPLMSHVAKEGLIVDMQDVFMRFTFDSSCATIFGRNLGYLSIEFPINEFANAIDVSTEAIFYRHLMPNTWWKLLRWLRVGRERKLAKAKETIYSLIEQYILLRKQEYAKGVQADDLLSTYINTEEGSNVEFLRDTMLNFLIAGRDTTSSGLSWFLWLISITPRTEAKILEELREVFSNKTKEDGHSKEGPWVFSWEDLKGLVYLHAAICESLRLYPPVPIDHKGVLKEDTLPSGAIVKPGMMIIYSIYGVGRMDWIWGKDCSEFKPERWIDEDGKLRHESSSKFLVFNAGPRSCLGRDMALTQMKLAAAALLFNFQFQAVEGHSVSPKPSVVLQMKNGLMVNIKERELF